MRFTKEFLPGDAGVASGYFIILHGKLSILKGFGKMISAGRRLPPPTMRKPRAEKATLSFFTLPPRYLDIYSLWLRGLSAIDYWVINYRCLNWRLPPITDKVFFSAKPSTPMDYGRYREERFSLAYHFKLGLQWIIIRILAKFEAAPASPFLLKLRKVALSLFIRERLRYGRKLMDCCFWCRCVPGGFAAHRYIYKFSFSMPRRHYMYRFYALSIDVFIIAQAVKF